MTYFNLRRRDTLRGVTAALGTASLRGFAVEGNAKAFFTHGVASGDPLDDRVILWTRVLPESGSMERLLGRWQLAADAKFERIVAEGEAVADPQRDNTVKIDAVGLAPDTQYWYRFTFNEVVSPVGRTRTLPSGACEQFSIGVCSCSNYPQGFFNAYRDMAEASIDLVMHLGDYIYEYANDRYSNLVAIEELGRSIQPAHEILSLEDYRQRYALYRTDPDLQAAHAAHPWICVWDDHELANNTWREGAENHNEGEGDFHLRMAIARRVYHEWMPIRTPAQTEQGPIYRSFKVGSLADIIMLDTRLTGRDEQLDYRRDLIGAELTPAQFRERHLDDPTRTMLGADQYSWLSNQLAASKSRGATWQFVGQQVLMGKLIMPAISPEELAQVELPERSREYVGSIARLSAYQLPMNLDAWDGYPACRARVFERLLEDASNPVVVAGDTHNGWAFNLRDKDDAPVGVEVGCPGISSPGIENYFPLPAEQLRAALLASSSELVALESEHRGWALITLTPDVMTSRWRLVSTVLSRDYDVFETEPLTCRVGQRQFA